MIIHADILEWAASYDGPLLQCNAADVVLPKDQQGIAVLSGAVGFTPIVCKVAMLNSRKLVGLIKARIGMPERAMHFDQRIDRRNMKIIAVSTQSVLPLIHDTHVVEDGSELLFKSVMCFTSPTSGDLLGGQLRMALTSLIGCELTTIGLAHLLSRLGCMRAAMHAVFAANVRLASHRNIQSTQAHPDRSLGQSMPSCYLRLRQAFDQIHLVQQIIGQYICSIPQLLCIAIRPSSYAQPIHFLPNGRDGYVEHSRDVFQWLLFVPI